MWSGKTLLLFIKSAQFTSVLRGASLLPCTLCWQVWRSHSRVSPAPAPDSLVMPPPAAGPEIFHACWLALPEVTASLHGLLKQVLKGFCVERECSRKALGAHWERGRPGDTISCVPPQTPHHCDCLACPPSSLSIHESRMKTCSAAASFPSVFICTWSQGRRSMLSLRPGAWHSLSPNAGNKSGCTERASCCPACDFERQEETKHLQASACSHSHGPAAFESPVTSKTKEPKAFSYAEGGFRSCSTMDSRWRAQLEERLGRSDLLH